MVCIMKTKWYKEMRVKVMDKNDIMQAHVLGHKMTGNCCFHGCPLPVYLFFLCYSASLLLYINKSLNGKY
uniref:Transmembrane protein n=1 Tax=Phaseolus vulgaris TaxID=3885 RepID=V7B3Z6_PHAVU|nr:hypothetical protein PHAVU_008G007000g [Phaseolus vulgaris]ESW11161.1 hypothetical protein PHAVU_008G007000g [Phaseolus vulgaris]